MEAIGKPMETIREPMETIASQAGQRMEIIELSLGFQLEFLRMPRETTWEPKEAKRENQCLRDPGPGGTRERAPPRPHQTAKPPAG